MKPRARFFRLFLFGVLSAGFFSSPEIPAQGVYVTRGKNGPVFSDRPQPDSEELELRPLTVIQPPAKVEIPPEPEEGDPQEPAPREAAVSYRSLAVVSPADGAGVAGDISFLEIRLAAAPPLARSAGHAFVVSIDGRPVDALFTAPEFAIPPDFWPKGYLPSNRSLRLDAAIVDAGGRVLMRAPPVSFRTLPVIVRSPPYPLPPWVRPPPGVRPAERPAKSPGGLLRHNIWFKEKIHDRGGRPSPSYSNS
ncbi:MAG: hypothetical protein LBE85_03060 [Candidatus Accumulibacter sp.]|jgi:hypothetical protein|nr:hypothetical protein [Accumulibacter sp.]